MNETKTIQVFECELCQSSHNMKNKRFVINKLAESMLKIELNKRMKKERERKIEKKRVGKPTIRL